MIFNKLVRDKIPEIMAENEVTAQFRVLEESEVLLYLERKLDEEVREFHECKNLEELADIFEVLKELVALCGASLCTFSNIVHQKREERGGFSKRICLVEIEEKSAENRCVICGEIIPEGRQVCPKCEAERRRSE